MDSNSDSMRPQKSARRSAGSAARSAATAALAVLALGAAASFSLFGVPHASADTAPQTYAPALAVPASIRMLQGPKPGKGAGWKQCAEVVFGQPDLASRDLSNGAGWEAALEVAGGSVYKFGSDVLAQYAAAVVSFEHAERKGADTASSDSSSSSSFAALNQQQAGERPMAPPERHIYTLKGATPASGQLPAIQFCVDYLHRWASTISLFSLQSSVDSVKTADQSRLRYLGADGQAYSLEPRETEAAAVAAQRKNQRHIVKVRQDASAGAFVPNWDTGVCQCLANPAAQRNAMNLKGATQTTTAAQQTTAAPPPPPPVPDVAPQTSTVARTQTMTSTTSNTRTTTTKPKPSPTGVIAGRVYLDANGNGIYDDGETGIPGVRLTLTGTDTQNVVQNIQVTTDPDGLYSFVDLWGTNSGFTITETQPTGFTNAPGSPATVITVAKLTNGQSLLGQDFGELAVSVTGTIFHDTIGNGLFGDGLNPIPNVTVKIYNTDSNGLKTGSPIYTTTSDYMGGYMFAPVTAGQLYVIERDLPTGYKDPTKGAITLTVNVTNQGLVNYGNDFPLLLNSPVNPNPAGTIGGVVYVDWNNNGLFDQETGISGVVLRLTGTDDLGTKISRLQITKPNGMFKWIGLRPGNYSIREYQPTGAYDSLGPTTSITGIVVVDGTNSLSNNFGEIVLWTQTLSTTTTFTSTSKTTITTTFVSATVGGRIAVDLNNNGAFNDFEPGLRSVTVRATGTNIFGAPVTTSAVTDCTGYYQFVMAAGDYTVSKTNLAGYVDAPNAVLKSSTNINVRGIAQYHNWLVVTDTSVMGSNTTNGCAISGRVYVDTQPVDNFFNISKENTITGVTIRLTGTAIDGTKVNVTTTSTSCTAAGCGSTNGCTNTLCADTVCTGQPVAKINMNGMFYFTGLKPGTYNLTETQPFAYLDSTAPGAPTTFINNIDLRTNCYSTGNHFPELGQAGYWTTSTTTSRTTSTSITRSSTTTQTTNTATRTMTNTQTVVPSPGSITGRVYTDDDGDGVYTNDVVDTPLGAIRIDILGTDWRGYRVLMSAYTDPQTGIYTFNNVPAGVHNIHENQPDGYMNPATGTQDDYYVTITSGLALTGQDFIEVPITYRRKKREEDGERLVAEELGLEGRENL